MKGKPTQPQYRYNPQGWGLCTCLDTEKDPPEHRRIGTLGYELNGQIICFICARPHAQGVKEGKRESGEWWKS